MQVRAMGVGTVRLIGDNKREGETSNTNTNKVTERIFVTLVVRKTTL
jgi:hypothetical protein